jgi:3-deoxy-alpha-D-manno-octulosonate 8-oxidase
MAHVSYGLPHMWLHAIGDNWKDVVTIDSLKDLFRRM